MTKFAPEVLSPAGNMEMLCAAVRSGANAVYLGATDFSARRNAKNFSIEELKEAVEYCHIRGVKVYLTLNILIKQSEFAAALKLAENAHNAGVDGIIVQDLGLARILHEKIPTLPLHASTQVSVHSPSALPLLKSLGFCQVVAAREMSREALAEFCKKAKELEMVVEVFVHGALCMSVSGQCLLSSFLGARSGNRGLCAGPCRLPFKVAGGTGYDLSLKDLSLLDHVEDLIKIGVGSFKIEGRMKRPEYVAAATSALRQAVDNGFADRNICTLLEDVFSRQGFTDGYYKNRLGNDMFGIRTKEDVASANSAFPVLHELYRKERQGIALKIDVKISRNEPISLTLCDGEHSVTAYGDTPALAKAKPITKEDVTKSISKLGNTPYFAENVSVALDNGLFVPASALNTLRREACEELDKARADFSGEKVNVTYNAPNYSHPSSKQKVYIRIETAEQLPDNLGSIDGIIFPLEADILALEGVSVPIIADIPRGVDNEEKIKERLSLFAQNGVKTALCGNISAVKIAKDLNFTVMADTFLNLSNSESLETARQLDVSSAVVSVEERLNDISALSSPIEKGIIAYGNLPLMLFKNCPLKNGGGCKACDKKGVITDRLGTEFPIRCRNGYSELLNSVPIWLADKQKEFKNLDFIILYFTREEKCEAERVISAYKTGAAPEGKHTKGLYFKGSL